MLKQWVNFETDFKKRSVRIKRIYMFLSFNSAIPTATVFFFIQRKHLKCKNTLFKL